MPTIRRLFTRFFRKKMKRTRRKLRGGNVSPPMNCSPAVFDKITSVSSCYTPKILLQIRDEYNKTAKTKITESDPTLLWKTLNSTFSDCKTEDCWLNTIKDADLKKRIDRYLFAPDKPYEWKKDPLTWLSNYDILNVLEQYEMAYKEFEFLGPTPIDFDKVIGRKCVTEELCKFNLQKYLDAGKTKIGIIFNLSPHNSGGSHWVSLFIDTDERLIFYFDSADSKDFPKEINALKNRILKQARSMGKEYRFMRNNKVHQTGNTECGVYSLFFIITMLTGKVMNQETHKDHKLSMQQRIHLFAEDTIPDKYMEKRREFYFN